LVIASRLESDSVIVRVNLGKKTVGALRVASILARPARRCQHFLRLQRARKGESGRSESRMKHGCNTDKTTWVFTFGWTKVKFRRIVFDFLSVLDPYYKRSISPRLAKIYGASWPGASHG